MSTAPNIKGFEAWINLQPPGPSNLIVIGEVETNGGQLVPVLTRAVPQGINPKDLILDLTIVDTGKDGTADVNFRPVRYSEPASQGQFDTVTIRWEGEIIETIPVAEVV